MTVNKSTDEAINEALALQYVSAPPFYYQRGTLSGTSTQPYDVTLFVKGEGNSPFGIGMTAASPKWDFYGRLPIVSIFTGAIRAANAVIFLFKTLFDRNQTDQASRQAQFKVGRYNLLRGLVEMVPLTFAPLMIHDVKRHEEIQKRIEAAVQEKNVVGIAIDGNVIATVPFKAVEDKFPPLKEKLEKLKDAERETLYLTAVSRLAEQLIKKNVKQAPKASMEKIARQWEAVFKKNSQH